MTFGALVISLGVVLWLWWSTKGGTGHNLVGSGDGMLNNRIKRSIESLHHRIANIPDMSRYNMIIFQKDVASTVRIPISSLVGYARRKVIGGRIWDSPIQGSIWIRYWWYMTAGSGVEYVNLLTTQAGEYWVTGTRVEPQYYKGMNS